MKPGVDAACTGDLAPCLRGVVDERPPPRRSVARPLTTSTSGRIGAGLKKCMPTMRAGCFMPAASDVIESDDVFDASIAVRRDDDLELAEQLALDVEVLDDRLDDELRADEVAKRVHGHDARGRSFGFRRVELALRRRACAAPRRSALRRIGRAHARVEQRARDGRPARRPARCRRPSRRRRRTATSAPSAQSPWSQRPVKRGGRLARNAATPSR